jgi:single-strand DNA-binding protein
MNKVTLIGRLTKDPELKFTPGTGTAVANFTIAVDRRLPNKDGQREADFIPIVVWGKQAESTANYMSKGKLIAINGRLQIRSYDAKDGTKRYITEIVAEEVQFLDKVGGTKPGQSNGNYEEGSFNPNSNNNNFDYGSDMTPVDDGDIPF